MDVDFSIITIENNSNTFLNFKTYLRTQIGVNYELIVVKNENGEFSSAREAFNSVLKKVKGTYVIFIHPDVFLTQNDILYNLLLSLKSLNNFGIVGVAGRKRYLSKSDLTTISNITQGSNRENAGKTLSEPVKVQSVDECLFVMQSKRIMKSGFTNIPGWHLYAVEECIISELQGLSNYVVPINGIWHMSSGNSLDETYMTILNEIFNRYDKYLIENKLNTTVKLWSFNTKLDFLYLKYYFYKQKIKKMLIRRK